MSASDPDWLPNLHRQLELRSAWLTRRDILGGRPRVLVCTDGRSIENLCSAVSESGQLCTHPEQHRGACWRGPTAVRALVVRPGEWVLSC